MMIIKVGRVRVYGVLVGLEFDQGSESEREQQYLCFFLLYNCRVQLRVHFGLGLPEFAENPAPDCDVTDSVG